MTNNPNPTEHEKTDQFITERFVTDLERFIAFLRDNPDIGAAVATAYQGKYLMYVMPGKDAKATIADVARRGRRAGAEMQKNVSGKYAGADLKFGEVAFEIYSDREQVCERIVVGTHQVEIEEPDPEAVAALPKVKRVETVEDVRWECTPLLAPTEQDDAEAVPAS